MSLGCSRLFFWYKSAIRHPAWSQGHLYLQEMTSLPLSISLHSFRNSLQMDETFQTYMIYKKKIKSMNLKLYSVTDIQKNFGLACSSWQFFGFVPPLGNPRSTSNICHHLSCLWDLFKALDPWNSCNLSDGSKGGDAPPWIQFVSFSCRFWKKILPNNWFLPQSQGLPSPLVGYPGFATDTYADYVTHFSHTSAKAEHGLSSLSCMCMFVDPLGMPPNAHLYDQIA